MWLLKLDTNSITSLRNPIKIKINNKKKVQIIQFYNDL